MGHVVSWMKMGRKQEERSAKRGGPRFGFGEPDEILLTPLTPSQTFFRTIKTTTYFVATLYFYARNLNQVQFDY